MLVEQDIMMVLWLRDRQHSIHSNTVGGDTITLSGSGTIASAGVGSKGVSNRYFTVSSSKLYPWKCIDNHYSKTGKLEW